jgi:mitochondrial fission protein ELM1
MSAPLPPPAPSSLIISEPYAGLQAQALGLAGAAGLAPDLQVLTPHAPWDLVAARLWPAAVARVAAGRLKSQPDLLISAGGVGAVVAAAQRPRPLLVHVQHPRMNPQKFDVVVVARHDALTGPNVLVTRTALHQVTPARLAAAAAIWRRRFADLPRPLVACLVGGSNGRFRLDGQVAAALAEQLATMMRRDKVGLAITPSRRTDPAAMSRLSETLAPLGAWIWDGAGDNPYFGLLALADAIVVTVDSVSMVSEAVATAAPVMLAQLPGRSTRIGRFLAELEAAGRVRRFAGRCELWPVAPLDDTAEIAAELRRRLGY